MQFGRWWGGIGVGLCFLSPRYAVRPNAPGLDPGALQQVAQQVGGSGLAVGAGNADDSQFFGRLTPITGTQTASAARVSGTVYSRGRPSFFWVTMAAAPRRSTPAASVWPSWRPPLMQTKILSFTSPRLSQMGSISGGSACSSPSHCTSQSGSVLHGSLLWVSLW